MRVIAILTLGFFLVFSLVTVPMAQASAMQGTLGRLFFRAVSPAFLGAMSAGTAVVLAVGFGIGVDYIVFKSGAITALKDWWNANLGVYQWHTDGSGSDWFAGVGGHVHIYYISGSWYWAARQGSTCPGGYSAPFNAHPCSGAAINSAGPYASAAAAYAASVGGSPPGYQLNQFTDTMDYGQELYNSQPSFPASTVYATPGAVNRITGGAEVVKTATMTDADADRFIAGLGATPIDTGAGTQAGSPPTTTDNTVTAGDTAQIGLLERMVNYLSNLIGIKTAADSMSRGIDNVVAGINTMSGKLDNVATFPPAAQQALDNISAGTQTVAQKLDNVAEGVQGLSETTAGVQTLSTRLAAIRDLAATKFPFSIGAALVITAPAGGNYDLGALHLPGMTIPIQPFNNVLGSTFSWMRSLIQALFWASTLFMIVRRVSSL